MEATALRKQGWSISAIARHLGHDRKTIRAYLNGQRSPAGRVSAGVDGFAGYAEYCTIRLADDPHLWATALFDEVVGLGYAGSYPSFTRALRGRRLRPHCEPCVASAGRDHAIIAHPPGAETQFDWLELPDPPAWWGLPGQAHLLVGALSCSGAWRAVLAESEDQPHLIEALHGVAERLGGVTKRWRFDRMATVCHPASGTVTASFAAVAKHYGVGVDICPSRHGNRKGVVEKGNHSLAQRWWRTVSEELSPAAAQVGLDAFCARADGRGRRRDGHRTTVGQLACAEPLRELPVAAFPMVTEAARVVSSQALVAWRGNFYSVGPGMTGATVSVCHRLGGRTVEVHTAGGVTLAVHHRQPDGAGVIARQDSHVAAPERTVPGQFSDRAPCRRKERRPASPAALAAAQTIRGAAPAAGEQVVIDFTAYVAAAAASTLPSIPEQETRR